MDSTEGVGDIDLRHVGHSLGQLGIVLGLTLLKTGVLQQHDLAALEGSGLGLGVGAHHIGGHDDVLAQQLAQPLGNRGQSQGLHGLLPLLLGEGGGILALLGLLFHPLVKVGLGLAQVGAGDNRRALVQQVLDGGQSGTDALVVGNGTGGLVLGHVEIAAQEDLLALYVDILDSLLVVVHVQ